jgi:hypothetical protein
VGDESDFLEPKLIQNADEVSSLRDLSGSQRPSARSIGK